MNDKKKNNEFGLRPYGLLGRKLQHSFSPELHKKIGDAMGISYPYVLFEKEPEELETFLRSDEFAGLNVTIPYKEKVIPYLDKVSEEAASIGAVNTIVRRGDLLIGYNTDYTGFKRTLEKNDVCVSGSSCLVLGSGGASKAVQQVLKDMGAEKVDVVSRNGEHNYKNIHEHQDAEIVVNATPVGMYPDTGRSLIYPGTFPNLKWVVDLIYNPLRTNLLCQAKRSLIEPISGLKMLVAQAAASAELFTGEKVIEEVEEDIERYLSFKKSNIVLIGMPGAGKTTLGAMAALKLNREFYDIDDLIIEKEKKNIPEIFSENGEDYFRDVETEVISGLSKVTGAVISCGGGVINREENYYFLAENGHFIFINRDISALSVEGRPVSQAVPMERLYQSRLPLYRSWCDDEIDITDMPLEEAVENLIYLAEA